MARKWLSMDSRHSSAVLKQLVAWLLCAQLILGEDFDLWMRIILKYPAVLLNTPLAFYNQDVAVEHRAVGKKTDLEKHFLFL
jgi:hypothetical protein